MTIPLLSFGIYFLLRFQYKPFLVCAILLLLVKEEALFAVLGLGLYVLIVQRKRLLGLTIILLVGVWFIGLVGYIFPLLTGRNYFFARPHLFGQLGTSIPEIISTGVYRPAQVWGLLASSYNVELVWALLLPLAFMPLAGIDLMLIAMPVFGMLFLTTTPWLTSHYPAPLVPPMFFATIVGLRRLLTLDTTKLQILIGRGRCIGRLGWGLVLLFSSLISYGVLGAGPLGGRFQPDLLSVNGSLVQASTYTQWINLVPRNAVVIAQEEVLPHFSARPYIYAFSPWLDCRKADYLVAKKDGLIYDLHKQIWDSCLSSGFFQTLLDKD